MRQVQLVIPTPQLSTGIVGSLPVEGDEFGIVTIPGDQITVSYSGSVKPSGELMDDVLLIRRLYHSEHLG